MVLLVSHLASSKLFKLVESPSKHGRDLEWPFPTKVLFATTALLPSKVLQNNGSNGKLSACTMLPVIVQFLLLLCPFNVCFDIFQPSLHGFPPTMIWTRTVLVTVCLHIRISVNCQIDVNRQSRHSSKHHLERCVLSRVLDRRIISIHHLSKLLVPGFPLLLRKFSQCSYQCLVVPFIQTIGLRMVCSREAMFDSEPAPSAHGSHHYRTLSLVPW